MNEQIELMRVINKRQTQWTEEERYCDSSRESLVQRIWGRLRDSQGHYQRTNGCYARILDLHRTWVGDLRDKKVLDLGHGGANDLSMYLARNCKEYHGIDLAERCAKKLRERLEKEDLPHARSYAVDFLADDFDVKDFDVIYAVGVAHHFKYFQVFLERAQYLLKPGGVMVTHDPLSEFIPARILRWCYRPFQSDADWEWPFRRESLEEMRRFFDVLDVRGFLGASKWGLPLWLLHPRIGELIGRRLDDYDSRYAKEGNRQLMGCVHVSCLLGRPIVSK